MMGTRERRKKNHLLQIGVEILGFGGDGKDKNAAKAPCQIQRLPDAPQLKRKNRGKQGKTGGKHTAPRQQRKNTQCRVRSRGFPVRRSWTKKGRGKRSGA